MLEKRIVFTLSPEENKIRRRLKPQAGVAFTFWKEKAYDHGLDYKTLMFVDGEYSGLPVGHNKHWCYPYELICKDRPEYKEEEES